jgi:hypothetical protein
MHASKHLRTTSKKFIGGYGCHFYRDSGWLYGDDNTISPGDVKGSIGNPNLGRCLLIEIGLYTSTWNFLLSSEKKVVDYKNTT